MVARPPLLVPLLAFVGFVLLLVVVSVDWAPWQRADRAASEQLRAYGDARPGLVAALRVLTDVAATLPYLVAGLCVTLTLLARRRGPAALFCATVTVAVPLLWGLGQALVHHPRPVDAFVPVPANGFPSGHTSNAAAACLALVLLAWPRLARTGRAVVVVLATLVAAVIGFTRVALLAHWPVDVLGGWLLALVVVPLAAHLAAGPRSSVT